MNYQKIYNALISNAQVRNSLQGYVERHHIVPKSLGGSDESINIIHLTAREHFIAHFLLAKIHGGTQWCAIIRFKHGNKKSYFNSRLYDVARRHRSVTISAIMSNRIISDETKHRSSLTQSGRVLSESHLLNLKTANSSSESRLKKSQALLGRKRTKEDISKMKNGWAMRRFKKECIMLNALIDLVFQPQGANA